MTSYVSKHAEFYASHPGYSQFQQELRTGGSRSIGLIMAEQSAHDFRDAAVPELVLALGLSIDCPFRWDVGDGWSPVVPARSGGITVCPPNTEIAYEIAGSHKILMLTVPVAQADRLIEEYAGRGVSTLDALTDQIFIGDTVSAWAMQSMWREASRGGPGASLAIDGHLHLLLGRLLQMAGVGSDAAEAALRSRSPCRLRDVRDALKEIYSAQDKREDGATAALDDLCKFSLFEPELPPGDFFGKSWIIRLTA
ncbi:MAG: hypothetical protein HC834_03390, partial [Rhodospirillales bacterium]|nr:hypothetical protein [Rhodospirillales bacterium]